MNMFDDLDPWEMLQIMQTRIETLETMNNEIVHHLKITTEHVDNIGKAVNQIQRDQVHMLRTLNTLGEHNDKTSTNN
jgi:uncharacterized membrane-anchored protein YhcB (DUF1043 family)